MKTAKFTFFIYFGILLLLLFPPICINDNVCLVTDFNDILKLLPKVFTNEKFKDLPNISILLKFINCIFILCFVFIKKIREHFYTYLSIYTLFLASTQNIAYIKNVGFVISTGSMILMLITSYLFFIIGTKNKNLNHINKKYLWMLLIVFICIWYPLNLKGQFDFNYNIFVHYLSSTMYCFNIPVFFSLIMIFNKNTKGIFFEIISLIGILFAIVAIIANASYRNGIPNMIMHFPLLISSLTMFINSFYINKKNSKLIDFK